MELWSSGETRLAFERSASSGDPLVLVHGCWDDHHLWDRVWPGLAHAFQVLRYDRRHHGDSVGPAGASPVEEDAGDLAGLLEAADLFPAHVVGHGFGGLAALRLANERPELVRSVVVHEAPVLGLLPALGSGAAPDLRSSVAAIRRAAELEDGQGALERFTATFASPGESWPGRDALAPGELSRRARRSARELGDPVVFGPAEAAVPAHPVPVRATAGSESPAWVQQLQQRLAAEVPNGEAPTMSGAGFWVPISEPDLFVGVLGRLLLERDVPTH